MKPFPHKCGTCRERAVEPVTLPVYSMKLEHDGRGYEVIVENLLTPKCRACGEIMLDEAAIDRLDDGLRKAAGLLLPAEIREGRERLGLKQAEMAALLKISPSTLSRWETGGQLQQRAMDLLLRAFFDVPELRAYLGHTLRPEGPPILVPANEATAQHQPS